VKIAGFVDATGMITGVLGLQLVETVTQVAIFRWPRQSA
jgi:hypothetical protein